MNKTPVHSKNRKCSSLLSSLPPAQACFLIESHCFTQAVFLPHPSDAASGVMGFTAMFHHVRPMCCSFKLTSSQFCLCCLTVGLIFVFKNIQNLVFGRITFFPSVYPDRFSFSFLSFVSLFSFCFVVLINNIQSFPYLFFSQSPPHPLLSSISSPPVSPFGGGGEKKKRAGLPRISTKHAIESYNKTKS